MTDWYWTDSGRQAGMHARPVVGGVFIKLLAERSSGKADPAAGQNMPDAGNDWAPLPVAAG